jgi:hypothetical protein
MPTEVKLQATDLKVSTEWDDDAQGVIASIKFKAKISGSDILTLIQLQGCPIVDCALGTDQMRLRMDVDKDTGEITGGDEKEK